MFESLIPHPLGFSYRPLAEGIGDAVARRTFFRTENGITENFGDVAHRLTVGNTSLHPTGQQDFEALRDMIARGIILMSGRHLQHGDADQKHKNGDLFTNCFDGDTRFMTLEYGAAKFSDVVGKTVHVLAGDQTFREAEVKSYGEQDLYEISFRPQRAPSTSHFRLRVKATRNHRWVLADGSETTDLSVGDLVPAVQFDPHLEMDPEAIRHGLIYGDGSGHTRYRSNGRVHASQGEEYCAIRLCGKDKDYLQYFEGYPVSYPPHAKGDPVVYVGKKQFWKQLPYTVDPSYVRGFIYGWWLADGYKGCRDARLEFATVNEDALQWLKDHAAYAGYTVTSESVRERKEGDGSYANGKPLHRIRLAMNSLYKVESIDLVDRDTVYCVEEPVTQRFHLANGLLTGNCSMSLSTSLMTYLLLNGSGVGSTYNDDLVLVDWKHVPHVLPVLRAEHADASEWQGQGWFINDAQELVDIDGKPGWCPWSDKAHEQVMDKKDVVFFTVEDSREGWARAIERLEVMTWERQTGTERRQILVLDFTPVRPKGAPIRGMQNRPASGPIPLMKAFLSVGSQAYRGHNINMPAWECKMHVDHLFAESVLFGGVRRAARIALKYWKDADAEGFCRIKRKGGLWTANNSLLVDAEFWAEARIPGSRANRLFEVACRSGYDDLTGEPGFINVDKLVINQDGVSELNDIGSDLFRPTAPMRTLLRKLTKAVNRSPYPMGVNPCSEIALRHDQGFCVVGDFVPYFCRDLAEMIQAARLITRALMRVNLMPSLYGEEVKRTNRIGVSITGMQEWLMKHFHAGLREVLRDGMHPFREALRILNAAVRSEAASYAAELGVAVPHTNTTIKPAGSTSKLFALTEGVHLAAMLRYVRWVQFREDDPLVDEYESKGYQVRRNLKTYQNTAIVGFPTQTELCRLAERLGTEQMIVTAEEASIEEQYEWLQVVEQNWIYGGKLPTDTGNQISATIKFKPAEVSYDAFRDTILEWQPKIKCASVMPQVNQSAYEYVPEEAVTAAEFADLKLRILASANEDIGLEHVDCAGGACPIDFRA